jgi:hypothetical protein
MKKAKAKKVIVSVKGGEKVGLTMVKNLIATVQGEKAAIGLFVTLAKPTPKMVSEAAKAGFYTSPLGVDYRKIQILTIEGIMDKTEHAQYPFAQSGGITFKKSRVEIKKTKQSSFFDKTS